MRLAALVCAVVLGISSQADHAWLFLVDDLHVEFVNTGRLRDLLRRAAKELIHDGDRHLVCASGPSAKALPAAMTADAELIVPAVKLITGNGLKAVDMYRGVGAAKEVRYRENVSLDAVDNAITVLVAEHAARKAIVLVSWGYDVEASPPIADRINALVRRANDRGIVIFAVDARGFDSNPARDPRVDEAEWQRYLTSTRHSLSLIAESTGGFVVERANDPAVELQRIAARMR